MKITVLTGDSAQVDSSGKAHVLGLGWNLTTSPLNSSVLLVIVELAHDEEPQSSYSLKGKLVNGDGVQQLTPGGKPISFELNMTANVIDGKVQRPAQKYDAPERITSVIPLPPGLRLEPGHYEWIVEVEGVDVVNSASFGVTTSEHAD